MEWFLTIKCSWKNLFCYIIQCRVTACSEVLIQKLCDWQGVTMYSCSHLEIDSIVVNSIFLLITEEKKNHMQKVQRTIWPSRPQGTTFLQSVYMTSLSAGHSRRKGVLFLIGKMAPRICSLFCSHENKHHNDRNTMPADILWRLEKQTTTFCMCLPPSSRFLF